MPVGRGGGGNSRALHPSPPLPTGILYSHQFRSHQEANCKMVAIGLKLANLEVIGNVVKTCHECLIYLLNRNQK